MPGTSVWSLVQEDPICCGAIKPVCHKYWASILEPMSCNYWVQALQPLKPVCLQPVLCNNNKKATAIRSLRAAIKNSPCWLQLEKACVRNEDPPQPKNKINKSFFKKWLPWLGRKELHRWAWSPRREELRQQAKEEGSREETFVYTCPVQPSSD